MCRAQLFFPLRLSDYIVLDRASPSTAHCYLSINCVIPGPSYVYPFLAGKFFNILLSVLLNGTELLPTQWGAVAMVFTGLLVSAISKSKGHDKAKGVKGKTALKGVAVNAHGGAVGDGPAARNQQKKVKGL